VAGDDDGRGQLGEARIDRQLPDGRLLAQSVEIGQQLLLADQERVALGAQAIHVIARGRDADGLSQREEGQQERQDDPSEQERQAVRPPPGSDGAP
jgi:hypothetical protein